MRPKENSSPYLVCRDVVIGYSESSPVIQSFSCHLDGAGLVRLHAPNGSGKSTLIEAASGYLRPISGSIAVSGFAAETPQARPRRRICRTNPALYPHMNVEDHLSFAAGLVGADPRAAIARATSLGLSDWLSSRADGLSTGSARKLWYLMCTLGDFDFIALDEPFNGLDEAAAAFVAQELNDWSEHRLVLVVCHTVPAALRISRELQL